jgi:TrmH family RNA methyltransferase
MAEPDDFDALAREYLERFPGRLRLAGPKHGVFTQIDGVVSNSRPNPRRLLAIEGFWALSLAEKRDVRIATFVFAPTLAKGPQAVDLAARLIGRAEDAYLVSARAFERAGERDSPDGLLALVELPRFEADDIPLGPNAFVAVLDGLEIPGNVGTIVRSVDGAGGQGIIMCNRKTRLTHPKLFKASQGSLFNVPIVDMDTGEAMIWLSERGFRVLLADTRAERHYWETDWTGRVAVVAGSERYGMSREWYSRAHELVSIPMSGSCDSLNVAIATTILAYEACMRQSGNVRSSLG